MNQKFSYANFRQWLGDSILPWVYMMKCGANLFDEEESVDYQSNGNGIVPPVASEVALYTSSSDQQPEDNDDNDGEDAELAGSIIVIYFSLPS